MARFIVIQAILSSLIAWLKMVIRKLLNSLARAIYIYCLPKTNNSLTALRVEVPICLLPGAVAPCKEFPHSAGIDVFAYSPDGNPIRINTGKQMVSLGFSCAIPFGWRMFVMGRSGLTLKGMLGFRLPDCSAGTEERFPDADVKLGLADAGYRGIVNAIVVNRGEPFYILHGSPMGQCVISRDPDVCLPTVDVLPPSEERGEQGFNS